MRGYSHPWPREIGTQEGGGYARGAWPVALLESSGRASLRHKLHAYIDTLALLQSILEITLIAHCEHFQRSHTLVTSMAGSEARSPPPLLRLRLEPTRISSSRAVLLLRTLLVLLALFFDFVLESPFISIRSSKISMNPNSLIQQPYQQPHHTKLSDKF